MKQMWETRAIALETLESKYSYEHNLIYQSFDLIDKILLSISEKSDFNITISMILGKAKILSKSIFSLVLDGYGQEAGALLRILMEAIELLIYIKNDLNRVQEVINNNLPPIGKIAKINNSNLHEIRKHLSNLSSHLNISIESLKHLIRLNDNKIEMKLLDNFDESAFIDNIEALLAAKTLMISITIECFRLAQLPYSHFQKELYNIEHGKDC